MASFLIKDRLIGTSAPPYLVAEMSANHKGDINSAFTIAEKAKEAGADAVKLQTYTPDTITIDSDGDEFVIKDGLWRGRTLYELYQEAHTPWEWHAPLYEHARKIGITIFSSPFDKSAVDLLEDLNTPAYKIASFEAIDLPLIRYVASTGKPMIISTGMASLEEIQEALETAQSGGCNELAILHCVSGYPAPTTDYNLRTIPDMAKRFGLVTGLSDHTLGSTVALAGVALGASIIEKHFTLDSSGTGPDDSFSSEPEEFSRLASDARTVWESLGEVSYGCQSSERENMQFRRSLYFVRSLKAGEIVTADAVRSVRPGYGIAPKHLDSVINRKVVSDVPRNTAVSWDLLE